MLMSAGGAALAYLFDPRLGRTRRSQLGGMIAGKVRRGAKDVADTMGDKAQYAGGRAKGALHGVRSESPPENDPTLVDKVRSEVLGGEPWRHRQINVSAADGVVTLNGQLEHPEDITRLTDEVRQVGGVRDVVSNLHLPGTPPPNKQEVMQTRVT